MCPLENDFMTTIELLTPETSRELSQALTHNISTNYLLKMLKFD